MISSFRLRTSKERIDIDYIMKTRFESHFRQTKHRNNVNAIIDSKNSKKYYDHTLNDEEQLSRRLIFRSYLINRYIINLLSNIVCQ